MGVLMAWLLTTPGGLLGKADAIGYAVCHRIDLRSFHLGVRQLPLCARCTGTYLGSALAIGILALGSRRRAGHFPPAKILITMALFGAAWAFDGFNSYLRLLRGTAWLYEPSNVLRLITGMLFGLTMGTLVYAGFTQSVWREFRPEPILRNFADLGVLILSGAVIVALVLAENPLILYPLALLSTLGIMMVLGAVYTVLAVIWLRRDRPAATWGELAWPLVAAFTLSVGQIAAIDLVRYLLTGTWAGFAFS
jgi:uncharacterized membrane protein